MKRLGTLALLGAVALAVAAPRWSADGDKKDSRRARITIYRIAPGKQLDFLKWMAEASAINKEAGVPDDHWYAHTNGDSWDYLHIAPDLSKEQSARVDEITKKHGRKTGFAASLEIRTFVAWHTDTFVTGPVSAADLVSAAGK